MTARPRPIPARTSIARTSIAGAGRPDGGRPRAWRWVAVAALVLLAGGALGGCSGGGSSASSGAAVGVAGPDVARDGSGGSAGAADGAAAPNQGAAGTAAGTAGGTSAAKAGAAGSTAVAPPRLVMTATLRLQVDDVTRRAGEVRTVAQGAGGSVTQEDLTSTEDGGTDPTQGSTEGATAQVTSTTGTMTLQVPQARLDTVLDQLARLGTVLQRTTSSQDVTSTYVDTSSRVATMQASVARLRTLLAKATDLGQVVALEDELTKREADLESTQAQLADLTGRTTMATVTLSLSTPAPAGAPGASGSPGFLDGLAGGWHAFVAVAAWLLTALGAVLPFLALTAAVALPVVAWRRRRTGTVEAPAGPATPAAPDEEKRPTVAS